jgi:uncharacterized integral membrane protein
MRALKTGFWVLIVVALFAFTYGNSDPIAVHIWPGLIWETKAPALVIGALLIGFVPTSLMLRATRWRLSRRISTLEATLAAQAYALTHGAEQTSHADEAILTKARTDETP